MRISLVAEPNRTNMCSRLMMESSKARQPNLDYRFWTYFSIYRIVLVFAVDPEKNMICFFLCCKYHVQTHFQLEYHGFTKWILRYNADLYGLTHPSLQDFEFFGEFLQVSARFASIASSLFPWF